MALSPQREVIKNAEGKIESWKPSKYSREHYHIRIWIEGTPEELNRIQRVEYLLHPSFRQPLRRSDDRAKGFPITIWTWGMFSIKITAYHTDGSAETLQYYLSYDLPADDGTNYVSVHP